MTREEFDEVFSQQYQQLIRFVEKRVPQAGADILHTTYINAVGNETYANQPKAGIPSHVWLWQKVRRELDRWVKREQRQQKLKGQALYYVYGNSWKEESE